MHRFGNYLHSLKSYLNLNKTFRNLYALFCYSDLRLQKIPVIIRTVVSAIVICIYHFARMFCYGTLLPLDCNLNHAFLSTLMPQGARKETAQARGLIARRAAIKERCLPLTIFPTQIRF